MVAAGVYLVARCSPLFMLAHEAQAVVAGIGAITALLAALIALTQTDLKRVLAYSTLSQLGYMFLALGSGIGHGEEQLVTVAVVAAIFHLFTHAFFKALLFLSAGSVMHGMGGIIDMRALRRPGPGHAPDPHHLPLRAPCRWRVSPSCPASGARTRSSAPSTPPVSCPRPCPATTSCCSSPAC